MTIRWKDSRNSISGKIIPDETKPTIEKPKPQNLEGESTLKVIPGGKLNPQSGENKG